MRSTFSPVALIVCALLPLPSSHSLANDVELFVAPTGQDSAAGTQAEPLATLAGAQRRLRELRAGDATMSATVWFHQGIYPLSEPVTFTAEDNAQEQGTTTYSALPDNHVVIRGGVAIHQWHVIPDDQVPHALPAIARPHVRVVDLSTLGIAEVAPHPRRSRHSLMQPTSIELFQANRRLPAAGWPNQGWARVPATEVGHRQWSIEGGLHEIRETTNAWAHGFWSHDWQDSCEPITLAQHVTGDRTSATQLNIQDGKLTGIRPGARYRIENLLSELDAPGEWYVDHARNLLYLWPEVDPTLGTTHENNTSISAGQQPEPCFVSTLDTPISCYDCERLTLCGLTIEGARAACVEIVGGEQVTLENCVVRHAGNLGINIYHGTGHRVTRCEVSSTGAGAIRVEGGQRETLTPANHTIDQNRLHDYCQLQWCYRPGVNVYGVGVTVENNEIHTAPHAAIILHGNDHRVLRNHIHHVCTDTDDAGAIYLGHNPTYRGNVIHENHIHDLGGFSRTGVMGIYLDDFTSGTEVSHNLLRRAGRGVAIGGGRDNVIDSNLFIDCLAAVQIDCRGTSWARHFVEGEQSALARSISELGDGWEVYTQRYPELALLLEDSPAVAKGNRIARNLYEAPIGIDVQAGLDPRLVAIDENLGRARQLLMDVDNDDFRWKGSAENVSLAYQTIDLTQIGPQANKDAQPARLPGVFVRQENRE